MTDEAADDRARFYVSHLDRSIAFKEALRRPINCTPEHRRRVYCAVAARLQRFADAHPAVRHDLATPEINRAVEQIDEALVLFMESKCEREKVSMAFDDYERSLLETTRRLQASANPFGIQP